MSAWYDAWQQGDERSLRRAIETWALAGRPREFPVDPSPLASHAGTLAKVLLHTRSLVHTGNDRPPTWPYEDASWPLWEAAATAVYTDVVDSDVDVATELRRHAMERTLHHVINDTLRGVVRDAARAARISRPDLFEFHRDDNRPELPGRPGQTALTRLQLLVLGLQDLPPQTTLAQTIREISRELADTYRRELVVDACGCPACISDRQPREAHMLSAWQPDEDVPALVEWLRRWLFNLDGLASGFKRLGSRARMSAEPGLRVLDPRDLVRTDDGEHPVSFTHRPCPQDLVAHLRMQGCGGSGCKAGRLADPDDGHCTWYVGQTHPDAACVNCGQPGCAVHEQPFDQPHRKVSHLVLAPPRLRAVVRVLFLAFGQQRAAPGMREVDRQPLRQLPDAHQIEDQADMEHAATLLQIFTNEPGAGRAQVTAAARHFRHELFSDAVRNVLVSYQQSSNRKAPPVPLALPHLLDQARSDLRHTDVAAWEEQTDQICERLVPADFRPRGARRAVLQQWANFGEALSHTHPTGSLQDPQAAQEDVTVLGWLSEPGSPAAVVSDISEEFERPTRVEAATLLRLLGALPDGVPVDHDALQHCGSWFRQALYDAGGLDWLRDQFSDPEIPGSIDPAVADVIDACAIALAEGVEPAIEAVDARRRLDHDQLRTFFRAFAAHEPAMGAP